MSVRIDRWMWWSLGLWMGALIASLFQGCYDAHAAEPCEDSGTLAEDKRQLPALAVDSDAGKQVSPGGVDRERSPDVECAGPIVAGECYADLEDWLTQ